MRHKVVEMKPGKRCHLLICSCGKKLRGPDYIQCQRNFELHEMASHNAT